MAWKHSEMRKKIEDYMQKAMIDSPYRDEYVHNFITLKQIYAPYKLYRTPNLFISKDAYDYYNNLIYSNKKNISENLLLRQNVINDAYKVVTPIDCDMKRLSIRRQLKLLNETLSLKDSKKFVEMKKNNKIQFYEQGEDNINTAHLLKENDDYICSMNTNDQRTAYFLIHELGHVDLYDSNKNDSYKSIKTYLGSYFNEAIPLLKQLLYIDRVKCGQGEKIKLMNLTINNYIIVCNNNINLNKQANYSYSYIFAFYLYDLYYNDRNKYIKIINKYYNDAFNYNDEQLLNDLGINETDLKNKSNNYIKKYEFVRSMYER